MPGERALSPPPSFFEFCAVSPPQCEHLNTFSCAVSPPLILSSMWCYVRCPHPSVNIWTHFLVRCPPLILSSMWCYVRCPSLILNSTQCPNLFVCGVFRPKSILELYPTPNSSFSIWHDTLKWNVNLAQLVSSSVALPAKLVLFSFMRVSKVFREFFKSVLKVFQ